MKDTWINITQSFRDVRDDYREGERRLVRADDAQRFVRLGWAAHEVPSTTQAHTVDGSAVTETVLDVHNSTMKGITRNG